MNIHAGYALVFDQEHGNRTFCQTVLEQVGYVVQAAEHANTALHLLETETAFDLLVVNATLVECDDGKVFHAIDNHSSPATVVVGDFHALQPAHTPLSNAPVLPMPCSRDELCAAVIVACQLRHTNAQHQKGYELAQAEKIAGMRRLSASIAHEINNPLQALQSSLRLLTEHSLAEHKREQILRMANEQVGQLVGVVQQMMDLHRPISGDVLRPVSIHEVLESVVGTVKSKLHERDVHLQRDWDSALPRVRGVTNQLRQVFGSIVVNALEAMPQGGKLIVRTQQVRNGKGPEVEVTIEDTGNGIAPSDLAHIFEPFYSTRAARTGLGLAVSYNIVEQHGGSITAESNGAGTLVRVVLPALTYK